MDSDTNKYFLWTIYQKDYVKKPIRLVSKVRQGSEFPDPIAEGFRKYLLLDETDVVPPNEDGELYLDKFKENRGSIANIHFKDPLNKSVIFKNKITKGMVSEYQTNYCDIEKDVEYFLERRERKHHLPDNTQIPLTTHTSNYRDPAVYRNGNTMSKPLVIKPSDSLNPCSQFMGNGISEYTDHIGRLGRVLVTENLFGKPKK